MSNKLDILKNKLDFLTGLSLGYIASKEDDEEIEKAIKETKDEINELTENVLC